MTTTKQCLICKTSFELRHYGVDGGTILRGRPGFGSEFDFDGAGTLCMYVCDTCFTEAASAGLIDFELTVPPDLPTTFSAPWIPHEPCMAQIPSRQALEFSMRRLEASGSRRVRDEALYDESRLEASYGSQEGLPPVRVVPDPEGVGREGVGRSCEIECGGFYFHVQLFRVGIHDPEHHGFEWVIDGRDREGLPETAYGDAREVYDRYMRIWEYGSLNAATFAIQLAIECHLQANLASKTETPG